MMKPIKLYCAPRTRASTVLWMLEECGAEYETQVLDLASGEQRRADYRAVNPMGKVPAIVHEGVVVTEAAAICAFLADQFPEAALAPAVTDPLRGAYYRWLFFAPSCLEPAVMDKAMKREAPPPGQAGHGDFDRVITTLAGALRGRDYLLEGQFTAADVVVGSGLRWTMMFKLVPELPEFVAYVDRLKARPAFIRAQEVDAKLTLAPAGDAA